MFENPQTRQMNSFREQLVTKAALAGGMAALAPEMSAPHGAVNSWGQGILTRAITRRNKRERPAAPTADVKREAGPPPAKKSNGKSDGKGGKNTRARYTVDQDGVQLYLSWNFGGGTCGELSPGSPCPAGRIHKCTTCRSDKHSARQCPLT